MHTAKSCCCGCTLRTGTLILLWLGAVCAGLSIPLSFINHIQLHSTILYILVDLLCRVIVTGIHVVGIYGVVKERPAYLKPFLGFQVFSMVSIVIFMILLAILGPAILAYLPASGTSSDKAQAAGLVVGIVGGELTCLMSLALAYYFFVVTMSFYKELRGEIPA